MKRTGWGFIALLGAVSGLSAFGMASVVPALPSLATTLSVDFSIVQFVQRQRCALDARLAGEIQNVVDDGHRVVAGLAHQRD